MYQNMGHAKQLGDHRLRQKDVYDRKRVKCIEHCANEMYDTAKTNHSENDDTEQ